MFSIYSLWHKQDLIVQAQKELDKERKHNQELRNQLSYASSLQYVEEQARDKNCLGGTFVHRMRGATLDDLNPAVAGDRGTERSGLGAFGSE